MRNVHEFLVVLLSQFHARFPKRVFAQDQRPDSFGHQEIHDPTAGGVQIVHHPSIALRRDPI